MEVLSTGVEAVGTMTCGVSCAGMHGCMKADDDNAWVQMLECMSSVGQVTDAGGGLSGHGNVWRWGNPDVSSARCNTRPEQHYIPLHHHSPRMFLPFFRLLPPLHLLTLLSLFLPFPFI